MKTLLAALTIGLALGVGTSHADDSPPMTCPPDSGYDEWVGLCGRDGNGPPTDISDPVGPIDRCPEGTLMAEDYSCVPLDYYDSPTPQVPEVGQEAMEDPAPIIAPPARPITSGTLPYTG